MIQRVMTKTLLVIVIRMLDIVYCLSYIFFFISGAVAIDEGFIILSSDLVKSILDIINTTLLWHPFGGQNIGIWLDDYPGLQAF